MATLSWYREQVPTELSAFSLLALSAGFLFALGL